MRELEADQLLAGWVDGHRYEAFGILGGGRVRSMLVRSGLDSQELHAADRAVPRMILHDGRVHRALPLLLGGGGSRVGRRDRLVISTAQECHPDRSDDDGNDHREDERGHAEYSGTCRIASSVL
jgi:hypothetical protein